MTLNTKTALRLALVAAAAVSVTACASRPKPSFPTNTGQTPGQGQAARPDPGIGSTPTPGGVGASIAPGSQQDFVVNAGDRVLFDFDSHELRGDATPVLDAQAAWLRRYPAVRVRIEGNTDELGTREYNLALGARRANAVRDYLVGRGVTSDRIATISYGKEQPVDTSGTEEGQAKNRNARTAIVSGAR